MRKKINSKQSLTALLFILSMPLLGSCGNDARVPTGGKIIIDTSSITYQHVGTPAAGGGCAGIVAGVGANTNDNPIRILTLGANGETAGKLEFDVSVDFAENTTTGLATTALFVVDGLTDNFVSAATDPSPFTLSTDEFGELIINLVLDVTYDSNCAYAGSIKITSGVHAEKIDFSVGIAAPPP